MHSSNDITARIIQSLSVLSPDEPSPGLNARIAKPLKGMSVYRILEIRCGIVSALNPESPAISAALNIIDGQLALREIAGDAEWR
jgi:hypothetical protein